MEVEISLSESQGLPPINPVVQQSVEVQSYLINYAKQDPVALVEAFEQNLKIVVGGEIMFENTLLYSDGLFGRRVRSVKQRLQEIATLEQAVLSDQSLYASVRTGKASKESAAITKARADAARMVEEDGKLIAIASAKLQGMHTQIGSWRQEYQVNSVTQDVFDDVLTIEKFLEDNQGVDSLDSIEKPLKGLRWDRKKRSRDDLKDKVEDFKYGLFNRNSYEKYKQLVWGYDKDGQHVLGFKDYQNEYAKAMREYNQVLQKAEEIMSYSKQQTALWEAREKEWREKAVPEAEQLKAHLNEVGDAFSYLQKYYLPNLNEVIDLTENIADGVVDGHRYGQNKIGFWTEIGDMTGRQTQHLLSRLAEITDPSRKLSLPYTPPSLASMARLLETGNLNLEQLSSQQNFWADVVLVLLGRGKVVIEEVDELVVQQVDIETADSPDVSPDLANRAAELSLTELNQLSVEQIIMLAHGGLLTLGQLAALEASVDGIKNIFTSLEGKKEGEIEALILSWLESRPKEEDLSLLAIEVSSMSLVAEQLAALLPSRASETYDLQDLESVLVEPPPGRFLSLRGLWKRNNTGINSNLRCQLKEILCVGQIARGIWESRKEVTTEEIN